VRDAVDGQQSRTEITAALAHAGWAAAEVQDDPGTDGDEMPFFSPPVPRPVARCLHEAFFTLCADVLR